MSHPRGQYYEVVRTSRVVIRGGEHDSRSRSHDRKYRRENRDDGYLRYGGESEYTGRSNGDSYHGRRSTRQAIPHESHSHHHGASEYDESKAVLAVFNLNIYTTESELYDVFTKFGPLKKATIVLDAKTGRSRGFGFVYFESTEDARVAHTQANGIEIGDRPIRVDYSATEKPHDPTPGVYYGRVSYPKRGGYGGAPPRGPPAMAAPGGHYHCQGCEIEARERERWERDARRYGNGREYYYQDRYAAPEYPRGRDRSAMSRSRGDYYRGGAGVR
ncbi:transformer-2 protein homolog alpha isoform X1 [Aedes aegypti]|uniref:RRM domain-containing protein n=1 Tax=Aedes aegypti TaxID=7159 RepID=A0A6I8TCY3_AEDAE|nr:transformer-2 protein homolog alpha isoform X1 [Aedes aegypti]XP_021697704.1 transformer-2 protein homolog alpha isoform X1 [Aedes aegypti]XP_021697705.1 transformer-2 protein homolog alpha isoform X1 [Aedes aegypti]